MGSPEKNDPQRARLAELSAELRDATYAALQTQSLIAAALDEARNEVDRLLMLDALEPLQCRRVERRARMMLDAWLNMTGTGSARSR
jgi:hypothetical protein